MVMAAPVTVTAAAAASLHCTRRIATAHVDHRVREGGQQQQDEQGAVAGVVGAEQAEHLGGQQAGDRHRDDQKRADQPQSAAHLCSEVVLDGPRSPPAMRWRLRRTPRRTRC